MERLTVDAGFPNENKGINEKPLLVRFIFPENWSFFLG
jgi:predicted sugar kinase